MLAGAGALHPQRALDQALVELLRDLGLLGLGRVDQQHQMEVAVADMAEKRHRREIVLHVLHCLVHALGEARNRHADVGRHGARARPDLQAGEVSIVARLPELVPLLGLGRPLEVVPAVLAGDRLHRLGLLDHRGLRAVELEEHGRRDAITGFFVFVDRADRLVADDIAARDRDARLDRLDHRARAAIDRIEGADCRRHRLLHRVQPHRDLGDDAERAFRADEEAREIVAGSRFLRAARGLDDAAIGEHDLERQHVLAHGAIAHGVRARGARRRHAAEGRIGPRIHREEKAGVLDVLVQLLARYARLHHGVQILLVHGEHLAHLREIDRHAAIDGEDVTLERSADAERDHRHAVAPADVDDVAHLFRAVREDHGVGQRVREVRLVLAMVLAHRSGGRHAIAEERFQLRDHRLVEFPGLVHGAILV